MHVLVGIEKKSHISKQLVARQWLQRLWQDIFQKSCLPWGPRVYSCCIYNWGQCDGAPICIHHVYLGWAQSRIHLGKTEILSSPYMEQMLGLWMICGFWIPVRMWPHVDVRSIWEDGATELTRPWLSATSSCPSAALASSTLACPQNVPRVSSPKGLWGEFSEVFMIHSTSNRGHGLAGLPWASF